MRVLFTTNPAVGHFHPLVPIARALETAGHLVAFASLPSFPSTVEASGLLFFPVGPHVREFFATAEMQEYARLSDPLAQRELLRSGSVASPVSSCTTTGSSDYWRHCFLQVASSATGRRVSYTHASSLAIGSTPTSTGSASSATTSASSAQKGSSSASAPAGATG